MVVLDDGTVLVGDDGEFFGGGFERVGEQVLVGCWGGVGDWVHDWEVVG